MRATKPPEHVRIGYAVKDQDGLGEPVPTREQARGLYMARKRRPWSWCRTHGAKVVSVPAPCIPLTVGVVTVCRVCGLLLPSNHPRPDPVGVAGPLL